MVEHPEVGARGRIEAGGQPFDDLARLPAGRSRGVLEGAFDLLDALTLAGTTGLSELSRMAGLPKTTTHRLLDQLTELGIVARDGRDYRVSQALRQLASPDRPFRWLRAATRAPLAELASASGSTAGLSVLRDRELITVASVVAPGSVMIEPGNSSIPLVTASGQALLADRPELAGPPEFSDAQWRQTRAMIQQQGAAFDRQDVATGICCVAAPVRGPDGRAVASLAVVVVAETIPRGLADAVRRSAREIEQQLARPVARGGAPAG
ncbi:IclR family transcriptional regulator [Frankia sp. QA3]|uniref:IclR family transcriptional regulator n=1 Tax=Frankia sp. QA3 TaxID=710111 RepID=UPI0002DE49F9|nr:helix-turn-helix domain-containing protein [Frankia sp. QA3]